LRAGPALQLAKHQVEFLHPIVLAGTYRIGKL
jgi:hypothetical protein